MIPSTFAIEFHQHLTDVKWENFLRAVARAGASIEQTASHRFVFTCVKRSQLQHVGFIVFGVGQSLCRVTEVSGEAQEQASVYASAS